MLQVSSFKFQVATCNLQPATAHIVNIFAKVSF